MNRLESIREVLIDAVLAGGAEVLAVKQSGDFGVRFKDAKELVTAADECPTRLSSRCSIPGFP